jgi:hypothetical protein
MSIAMITAGVARTVATKEYVASVAGKPYKEYVAVLTQSGLGNNPTMSTGTALQNELSGPIAWTTSGVGIYTGTLNGAFTVGKTTVYINGFTSSTNSVIRAYSNSVNSITINTTVSGTLTDSILSNAGITIRVYN